MTEAHKSKEENKLRQRDKQHTQTIMKKKDTLRDNRDTKKEKVTKERKQTDRHKA